MRWNIYNVAWLGLIHCIVPVCYAEDFLPATYGALPDVVVKRSELIQYTGFTGASGSASAATVGTITVQ